jgi:general secretion pathway protein A
MNREIMSYFNLNQNPFDKEIKTENLHLLPSIEKYLKSLELLIETKGIGVMTGKSGTGKSCIIRLLKNKLNAGLYKVLYLCHSSTTLLEFYSHVCALFGLETKTKRGIMFRTIKDHIIAMNKSQRIHPVLIIDEAHLLNNDILQEIRLLTNFEIDSYNAITILFCGHENLNMKLGLSILESLANSITINISVDSLNKEEAFSYVEKRINHCGNSNKIFTNNALTLIHQGSGGIFRIINKIAHASLVKAYLSKSSTVEVEHVKASIER